MRNKITHSLILVAIISSLGLALLPVAPFVQPALATGGDLTVDFIAAGPYTYNHATGGGAYNDRTVGKDKDVVESLEGGDFQCNDIVTYLPQIRVVSNPVDANQTVELQFSFLAETTGQPGVAHVDVTQVGVNYGLVQNGDNGSAAGGGKNVLGLDSGIKDDRQTVSGGDSGIGGSTATIVAKYFDPTGTTPFNGAQNLILKIRVTDLEAGELVVVRIDTRLGCLPGSDPTGNLQAQFNWGKVVEANGQPADSVLPGGEQTIPFKQIGDIPVPTVVDLASFEAVAKGRAVQLTWQTASEIDNLGFNLYRAESLKGPRTKLNSSLIPAQAPGSPVGATYQFTDKALKKSATYYYWLQAVDVNGMVTEYGPVSASVASANRKGQAGPVHQLPIPPRP